MSKPPYRALRIVLGIIALITAIGGLVLIVGSKPLLIRLFLSPPEAEMSTMLMATVKETGIGPVGGGVAFFPETRGRGAATQSGVASGKTLKIWQ
jgi:hypothetical protein